MSKNPGQEFVSLQIQEKAWHYFLQCFYRVFVFKVPVPQVLYIANPAPFLRTVQQLREQQENWESRNNTGWTAYQPPKKVNWIGSVADSCHFISWENHRNPIANCTTHVATNQFCVLCSLRPFLVGLRFFAVTHSQIRLGKNCRICLFLLFGTTTFFNPKVGRNRSGPKSSVPVLDICEMIQSGSSGTLECFSSVALQQFPLYCLGPSQGPFGSGSGSRG